jgi:hypothetical protein
LWLMGSLLFLLAVESAGRQTRGRAARAGSARDSGEREKT